MSFAAGRAAPQTTAGSTPRRSGPAAANCRVTRGGAVAADAAAGPAFAVVAARAGFLDGRRRLVAPMARSEVEMLETVCRTPKTNDAEMRDGMNCARANALFAIPLRRGIRRC